MANESKRVKVEKESLASVSFVADAGRDITVTETGIQGHNDDDDGRNDLRVYPKSANEPNLKFRLYGNTVSGHVEVCGWSTLPTTFTNLHASTKFRDMSDADGNVIAAARERMDDRGTLAGVQKLIGRPGRISCPVYVHVIAKRKVDITILANKIMIIPVVVIGDSSGYATMVSFNEGLETIYNRVVVGDCLFLTLFTPQRCKRIYHKGLFSDDMFLDMELKVSYYTVRNQYLRTFSVAKLSEFKFPDTLFDASYQLKVPTEAEQEIQASDKSPSSTILEDKEKYFDLIGVICYVSRIERYRLKCNEVVECLVNGEYELRPFTRFVTYRWIYLVDETSSPVRVKLYHMNLECQAALIPGAIVLLTHCQTEVNTFVAPYIRSSHFTQTYVNEDVPKYFLMHPKRYTAGLHSVVGKTKYMSTVSRSDVDWAAGGIPTLKIIDKAKFAVQFPEMASSHEMSHLALGRRESLRVSFAGTVMRVFKVDVSDSPVLYYKHPQCEEQLQQKICGTGSLDNRPRSLSWFSFMLKLPAINTDAFQLERAAVVAKKLEDLFKDFCDPLLLPARIRQEKIHDIANLEKLDGPPYFLLDITDEINCQWYRCAWKTRELTLDEMTCKIDSARGRKIKCLINITNIENGTPLEVLLCDFFW